MEDWQTALDAANAAISKSGCSIGTGTAVTGGMNDATANVLNCEMRSVYPEEEKPFWQWDKTVKARISER